jgi:type II secretory pathway pseudopilin PulG
MKYRILGTVLVIVILIILAAIGIGTNGGSSVEGEEQQTVEQQ